MSTITDPMIADIAIVAVSLVSVVLVAISVWRRLNKTTEPEFKFSDGTIRKKHYGSGKQPWDTMVELGWAHTFAAANALKYVRRFLSKNGDDDLDKGLWYFLELCKMASPDGKYGWSEEALSTYNALLLELTPDELNLLRGAR